LLEALGVQNWPEKDEKRAKFRATTMLRPSLHRHSRGIPSSTVLLLLLSLAAFASSLWLTLRVTSTLTTWSLQRRIREIQRPETSRWRRGGGGIEGGDDDDSLGSHLALFDDDSGDEEGEETTDGDEDSSPPPPPLPPAGACAPMEHTE